MQITEHTRNRLLQIIYGAGYSLLIVGAFLYFSNVPVAPYLFSLGVVFIIIVRVILPIDTDTVRTKRLNKINAYSSLILVATVYAMFIHHRLWIAGLLLSTLIDIYISFRLPKK